MTDNSQEDPKPDGAAFDDYFESLGKKAEDLRINEQKAATNGTASQGKPEEEEEQKVVDEIESLCMNCRENVFASLPVRPVRF
jgi:zinc finger protein